MIPSIASSRPRGIPRCAPDSAIPFSLDQFAARRSATRRRFPSLSLSAEGFGLSWTRSGALVPPDLSPANVFARLFLEGKPDEVQAQERRLQWAEHPRHRA